MGATLSFTVYSLTSTEIAVNVTGVSGNSSSNFEMSLENNGIVYTNPNLLDNGQLNPAPGVYTLNIADFVNGATSFSYTNGDYCSMTATARTANVSGTSTIYFIAGIYGPFDTRLGFTVSSMSSTQIQVNVIGETAGIITPFEMSIQNNGTIYTNSNLLNGGVSNPPPGTYNMNLADFVNGGATFLSTYTNGDSCIMRAVATDPSVTSTSTYAFTGGLFGPLNIPCFTRGSMILTADGEKAIETLKTGDRVRTANGRDVKIKMFNFTIPVTTKENAPFCISAGSLGHHYPPNDIILSPRHAIKDSRGVWQFPKFLNHNPGVKQYGIGSPIEYFHIECPNFFTDDLVVNGSVAESFKNLQGPVGVVYVWSNKLNGFTRNAKEDVVPVPNNPKTLMIYA